MRRTFLSAAWRGALLVLGLTLLLPAAALAQTGRITGTVKDTQGAPLEGAQVSVDGTRLGALTDARGRFTIASVPTGTHRVVVRLIGFRETSVSNVAVQSGQTVDITASLEGAPVTLGGIVVSASRRAERVTDAPATVTRINAEQIDNAIGPSWAGALKQAKGLDFIQVGMTSVAINARGFNSSFNNRMLMMEDGRIDVLPENGLPVGQLTAVPKVDLSGVEVLVGPGAALYGPDASNGVVTLQSKDPREYSGTTVEVTGGNRSYADIQMRHAGTSGQWGYKVAGEYQHADDWQNRLTYASGLEISARPDSTVDWTNRVARGTGSIVRYGDNSRLELSGGMSRTDGVGQTNVGRNQLDGWLYNFLQMKYSMPHWFFNAYRAQSKAGDSYAINRYTDNRRNPANAGKSNDEVRHMSDWPSNGRLYAAEAQGTYELPMLLNSTITFGGQLRHDVVSSNRKWLSDRLTGKDLTVDQKGLYAQLETPITPWMQVVLAGRYDNHDRYDAQWSPKAGLVFKPAPEQAVRVTYNRAFKSPTVLQTDFYIPDWNAVTGIYGNTKGFTVRSGPTASDPVVTQYAALQPENNDTWELGYKGVLGTRLFLDVAGYHSRYDNFLSPLVIIANPYTATGKTYAFDASGKLITNAGNAPEVVLIYYNLGRATLNGVDAGANYMLNRKVGLTGTYSWLELKDVQIPAGREEATALNAPKSKWTLGVNAQDLGSAGGAATVRHVGAYYFRSGINMGVIPTFTTFDLNVGYKFNTLGAMVNLGVSNLFTCSESYTYAASDALKKTPTSTSSKCGFGQKHLEMINMPNIGTMVFLGVRFQR